MGNENKQITFLEMFKNESEVSSEKIDSIPANDDIPYRDEEEEIEEQEEEETTEEIETQEEETEEESEEYEEEVETEESETEDQEEGVYSTFANTLIEAGIISPLEGKDYDDSEDGLITLFEDNKEIFKEEVKNSYESIEIKEGITLKDFISFVDNGGNPSEFFDKTVVSLDYSKVDVETDDDDIESSIATQKLVIRDKLVLEELSEEEIEETLEQYEDSGILEKQAKIALKTLVKKQNEEYVQMLKNQEVEKVNRIENIKKQEAELKAAVMGLTKVGNLDTSEKELNEFYKYLTVPIKKDANGNSLTKHQIENESLEKRLELAYLQFKGGVATIEAKVEKKKNLKLKEQLSRFAKEDKNLNRTTDSFEETTKTKGKLKLSFPEWM